jgi:hypothetical protein
MRVLNESLYEKRGSGSTIGAWRNPTPTPFEKFEEAAKRFLSVPKKDVEKAELRKRKEREAREAAEHRD